MISRNVTRTKLLIEQHLHGAYGVDFACCNEKEVLELAQKLLFHGIGGFYPTLATDSVENIKRQIKVIKTAAKRQKKADTARILGIHLEGIFLNPEKKGIHNEKQFLKPTVENYKLIEDDFIKIVTLAPELDEGFELRKYLKSKGVKVQAGHCVGGDLSDCDGVTHLFNAMSPVSHKTTSTALSALIDDEIYTEIIADGVHVNDEALKLTLKSKPADRILLVSDCLPIANSCLEKMKFCGKEIFYDGEKATDKKGTLAGSTVLLNKIVQRLMKNDINAIEFINNSYEYLNVEIDGSLLWDEKLNIISIEKDGVVFYSKNEV